MTDTEKRTAYTFNRDYDDQEQVAEYLPAYMKVYDEITAAGRYPYDDSFRGRIAGIEGPSEITAIYLLQGLRRAREQAAKVAALVAQGYEHVTSLNEATMRCAHVIFYSDRRMGGEWNEWRDARLVGTTDDVVAVLPKGKRTHGHLRSGRLCLVLRGEPTMR